MHAYRPYQILRRFDHAPELPFDYLFSLLLALCPTAWFAAMDPLVERFCGFKKNSQGQGGGKTSKTTPNMQPAYVFFAAFYLILTLSVMVNF